MSTGKDAWADLIGEQTDPDLDRHQAPNEAREPPTVEAAPPADAPKTPLTLPAPDLAPTVEAPARPPAAPGDFSVEHMVDKLAPPAATPAPSPGFWAEWKEVVLTALIGVAALLGLAFFPIGGSSEPAAEGVGLESPQSEQSPRPPDRPAGAPPPAATPGRDPTQQAPQARDARRAAPAPVVSVVTTPPGALVQIDGVVYGRSPLVLPAPSGKGSLEMTLLLDDHESHTEVVEASDAGHFSLNVELSPRR